MNLYIHSMADNSNRQLTRGLGGDFQPQWSPDGRRLVFFSSRAGNADIWLVDISSGAMTQLTSDHALDIHPFFSPDGAYIAFQSARSCRLEVWRMKSHRREPRQLSKSGVTGHFLPWVHDRGNV